MEKLLIMNETIIISECATVSDENLFEGHLNNLHAFVGMNRS